MRHWQRLKQFRAHLDEQEAGVVTPLAQMRAVAHLKTLQGPKKLQTCSHGSGNEMR